MDWNKKIIKSPLPVWVIIVCALLSGCFLCVLINLYDLRHIIPRTWSDLIAFVFGATGYTYIYCIYTDKTVTCATRF